MNKLIIEANNLLRGQGFEYAICGGYAIDLFLGKETRMHGDIDILAYWKDRDQIITYMWSQGFQVFEMLGGGKAHQITDLADQQKKKRNIFCVYPGCPLVQLQKTQETDIYGIVFDHVGQEHLDFIEFLFNDKTETELLYARNPEVKREIDKSILSAEGIPYLAPEWCLLYKSTDPDRESNQQDYTKAMGKMLSSQKEWLNHALKIMYPEGHNWTIR